MTAVIDRPNSAQSMPVVTVPIDGERVVRPLTGEGLERYLATCDASELRQLVKDLVLDQVDLLDRFVPGHLQVEADYSALLGDEEPEGNEAEGINTGDRGPVDPTRRGGTVYQVVDIADA